MTLSLTGTKHRAHRAARQSDWVERAGRAGLASRGLLYVLVGMLAVRLALGRSTSEADQRGAMATLAQQPFGRVLLPLVALGFLGYAAWRFTQAVVGGDDGQSSPVMRLAYAGRGVIYLSLAYTAVSMTLEGPEDASGRAGHHEKAMTARVMTWPFGRVLVVAIGLAIIAAGLWNGYRAVTRRFEKDLKEREMADSTRSVVHLIAIIGLLGRMSAYVITGSFLAHAAWTFNPEKAIGLDASLHAVAATPRGRFLLVVTGIGLMAFGGLQGAMARFRRVMGS